MAGHQHDQTVPYADVVAPGASVKLDAWECWIHHEGTTAHYYAKGPCPSCGAQSQGHAPVPGPIEAEGRPIEAEGRPERAPPPSGPVEIPLRCTCGSTHGRDGANGCGRRWSIICHRE